MKRHSNMISRLEKFELEVNSLDDDGHLSQFTDLKVCILKGELISVRLFTKGISKQFEDLSDR